LIHPFSVGQSSDAYWRAADRAFGITSQLVGTIRIHCPVANNRTANTRPLRIHSASSVRWNQSSRLILVGGFLVLISPLLFRVQWPLGRVVVRTCQPVRMMSSRKNAFRKCCHANQAGILPAPQPEAPNGPDNPLRRKRRREAPPATSRSAPPGPAHEDGGHAPIETGPLARGSAGLLRGCGHRATFLSRMTWCSRSVRLCEREY
jgi:hypothetical protein